MTLGGWLPPPPRRRLARPDAEDGVGRAAVEGGVAAPGRRRPGEAELLGGPEEGLGGGGRARLRARVAQGGGAQIDVGADISIQGRACGVGTGFKAWGSEILTGIVVAVLN